MKGFEFNKDRHFDGLTLVRLDVVIHDDEVWIHLPPFKWDLTISAPPQAERLRLEVSYSWIDFSDASYFTSKAPPIFLNRAESFNGGKLKIVIRQESEWFLVVMTTICFDYNSSGPLSVIGNKRYQAGRIAEVLHFSDGKVVQHQKKHFRK